MWGQDSAGSSNSKDPSHTDLGGETMKKRKSGLAVVKYIVVVVVLINVLASVLPLFLDTAGDLFGDSDSERYSDLRIIDVQGQMVPDYKGRTAGDGYQMYRFDLTVNNQGSHVEQLAYISFYLSGNDGEVYMQYDDTDSASSAHVEDTRILPVGRDATVSIYAEISDGTTSVEISNYNTPDNEEQTFVYTLAEGEL